MKRIIFISIFLISTLAFSQARRPAGFGNVGAWDAYLKTGSMTLSHKIYDAPAFTGISTLTTSSALTSGTYRSFNIGHTQTGAGNILEALRVNIDANVQTGSWANAIAGRIDYGASGGANGGMAAPICSELSLPPAATSGGSFYALDLEIDAPTSFVHHGNASIPAAWMNIAVFGNATAIGSWEDNAHLFRTDGLTDASGNVWYDNTIRVRMEDTNFYIPLSDAEGEYSSAYMIDISNATDASSLTAASIATDGGLAVSKQLYLGDDLDMSVSASGTYDITLKDAVADALSIVRGTTDMMVFNSSVPSITITPPLAVTGAISASAEATFLNNAAAATFGNVLTDADVVLAFDAVTAQGSLTYMEDEDRFDFDNDVDVIGDLTAGTITSDAAVTATSGMDLGTSQALIGTTAMTIGNNAQTVAINSSDWDIGATGDMTGIGAITADGALVLESSRTGGANTNNSYKITLGAGETFTGTTGHSFKVYDADNTVVHDGGEHCGVYVNMKLLSAMASGGKSVLFSGHNYGAGGDYQVIDAGVWLYGNLVDAFKVSGGSIDTGLDLSETTVTGADIHFSWGGKFYSYAGSPNGSVTGAVNDLCVDTTNHDLYINTDGSTTWAALKN